MSVLSTNATEPLYEHYGHHNGSSIFGQFGTNFFFRNNEPEIGKLISNMCGTESVTKHQKNTSFGANEFRDGVSYNEHTQKKNLIEYSDVASLKTRECFVLFPEPEVRLAKIEVPAAKIKDKNKGFVRKELKDFQEYTFSDNDETEDNSVDKEVLDVSTKSVHHSMSTFIKDKEDELEK